MHYKLSRTKSDPRKSVRTIFRTTHGGGSAHNYPSSVGPAAVADMSGSYAGVGDFPGALAEEYVSPVRSDF